MNKNYFKIKAWTVTILLRYTFCLCHWDFLDTLRTVFQHICCCNERLCIIIWDSPIKRKTQILKLFSAIHHFELSVQVFRVFQFQGILKILASLSRLEGCHGLVGSSSCVNTPWAHLPAVIWFFSLFLLIHSAPPSPNSIFHSFQRFPPRLAHPFPVVQFESAFASHLLFLFRVLVDSQSPVCNIRFNKHCSGRIQLEFKLLLLFHAFQSNFMHLTTYSDVIAYMCLLCLFHLLHYPFVENINLCYFFVCSVDAVLWCFLTFVSSTCGPSHLLLDDVC